MDPRERHRHVQKLFLHARELTEDSRVEYLNRACGDDADLRRELDQLLAHDERSISLLDAPFQDASGEHVLREKVVALFHPPDEGSGLPCAIGPFRIRTKLGEGGMGAVYEAEQESPRRTVALKVLGSLFRTPDSLRRFEHESEFLARLQHPGIAQVFESGRTDTEQGPLAWFAMELIRGESLIDYADRHSLPPRERLELVARMADAVQHAHEHGVIHRDLKPQNVLVDDSGQPKILDFGIARACDSDVQLTTLQTDVGQVLGTLAYMSPEQAAGDPRMIDTRSDVYSLGVLLYELLAGRLPYDVTRKSLPEAVRVIRDDEPRALATVKRAYRGDVDTIARTALEKDKQRRYASAAALAADIRRFLRDEPIEARRPSRMYTLRKFARRNKAVVYATSGILISLSVGLALSLRYAFAEAAQRRVAEHESYLANLPRANQSLRSGHGADAREMLDNAAVRERRWEWGHLDQKLQERPLAQTRIPGVVEAVLLDETQVLAVDSACDVHVWNALTGETTIHRAPESSRSSGARPLALSVDGSLLLSYAEGALLLGDPLSDEEPAVLPYPAPEPKQLPGTCALTPDGARLVVATVAGDLVVLDVGGESRNIPAEELGSEVRSVAISSNGLVIAAGMARGHGGWDAETMEQRYFGKYEFDAPPTVALAPDGTIAATAETHQPSPIYIRSMNDGGSDRIWKRDACDHGSTPVTELAFSIDQSLLAARFADGGMWILDARSEEGTLITSIESGDDSDRRIRFSPSGAGLLTFGPDDDSLQLWSSHGGVSVLRGHRSYVYSVDFRSDGAVVASGSWDGDVRLWNGFAEESVSTLHVSGKVHSLTLSPDGTQLACAKAWSGLDVLDMALGRVVWRPMSRMDGVDSCFAVAYSPDGDLLAAGQADGRIVIWHTDGFEESMRIEDEGRINAIGFHPDGAWLASGTLEGKLSLWDAASGTGIGRFQGVTFGPSREAGVNSLAFSPDGTRIVVGWGNSEVTILEVPSLRQIDTLRGHDEEVFAVAYSPDGTRIASGGRDGLLRLWDVATGGLLLELEGHTGPYQYIKSLAFSPDGRRIATGSGDSTVRIWHSEPATERWERQ